jgi:hypothetical protein
MLITSSLLDLNLRLCPVISSKRTRNNAITQAINYRVQQWHDEMQQEENEFSGPVKK